jgi:steroid delta-isomerase-like uncharacterized protein
MQARHALTILAVRDLAAAVHFYKQAFGWQQVVAAPVYVEFALPGAMRLGLYQRESFAKNTGRLPADTPPEGITPTELYFYVEQPDRAVAALLEAGAQLLSGLAARDWGDEAAYVADLDGNVIVVARAARTTTAANLRDIAERWLCAWHGCDVSIIDELHAADFVDHSASGRATGNEGFKRGIVELYAAFPDFFGDADEIYVDEHAATATIRWTATGTHKGTFLGVAPTNKRVTFRGIEILTVRQGKVVERWGEWDGIDLACQLGALRGLA